jgi:hypothetical protein
VLLSSDKGPEVWTTLLIHRATFRINDAGFARQPRDRTCDVAEAGCKILAVLRKDDNLVAALMKLLPVAVELDLVTPAFAGGRRLLFDGLARRDEERR